MGATDAIFKSTGIPSGERQIRAQNFQRRMLTEETVENLAEMTIPRGYSDAVIHGPIVQKSKEGFAARERHNPAINSSTMGSEDHIEDVTDSISPEHRSLSLESAALRELGQEKDECDSRLDG